MIKKFKFQLLKSYMFIVRLVQIHNFDHYFTTVLQLTINKIKRSYFNQIKKRKILRL